MNNRTILKCSKCSKEQFLPRSYNREKHSLVCVSCTHKLSLNSISDSSACNSTVDSVATLSSNLAESDSDKVSNCESHNKKWLKERLEVIQTAQRNIYNQLSSTYEDKLNAEINSVISQIEQLQTQLRMLQAQKQESQKKEYRDMLEASSILYKFERSEIELRLEKEDFDNPESPAVTIKNLLPAIFQK